MSLRGCCCRLAVGFAAAWLLLAAGHALATDQDSLGPYDVPPRINPAEPWSPKAPSTRPAFGPGVIRSAEPYVPSSPSQYIENR